MKLWISRYELCPRGATLAKRSKRVGALIRFFWPEIGEGFADCHPWPELGDLPLEGQLESLISGNYTGLTRRALEFARWDAEARLQEVNLLNGLRIPRSHWFIRHVSELKPSLIEEVASLGYRFLKVKAGGGPPRIEIEALLAAKESLQSRGMRLRLDFNERLTLDGVKSYSEQLGSDPAEWIDWFEDPIPYDPKAWKQIRQWLPVRLGLDRGMTGSMSEMPEADVLVMKPAVVTPASVYAWMDRGKYELTVTSYLDHPLGQACASWVAAQALRKYGGRLLACGLESYRVYEDVGFPQSSAVNGTGFGFDRELAAREWQRVV